MRMAESEHEYNVDALKLQHARLHPMTKLRVILDIHSTHCNSNLDVHFYSHILYLTLMTSNRTKLSVNMYDYLTSINAFLSLFSCYVEGTLGL